MPFFFACTRAITVPWSVPPSGVAREPSGPGGPLSPPVTLRTYSVAGYTFEYAFHLLAVLACYRRGGYRTR